jgi:hypothetical protein
VDKFLVLLRFEVVCADALSGRVQGEGKGRILREMGEGRSVFFASRLGSMILNGEKRELGGIGRVEGF